MKRIALFLDGTWNDADSNTNVWRANEMLESHGSDGTKQISMYQVGVGKKWYEPISGGAFGKGLSENVLEAYQWLQQTYDDGADDAAPDEVFIFGYSRGAYTARSLAGLIARCGLLNGESPLSPNDVYERYRAQETPLYTLEYWQRRPHKADRELTRDEQVLLSTARRIKIKFIGVWDTVGTLGIPFADIPGVSSKRFAFHNTRLSTIYEHCYHALAIDEHRKPFQPTLWTDFIPKDETAESNRKKTIVEQRWFVGAHANVGGGGEGPSRLAKVPLHWMLDHAERCGLKFKTRESLDGTEHLDTISDSFARFLVGVYRILKLGRRFYRVLCKPDWETVAYDGTPGRVETVNEVIDETVIDRMKQDHTYRPRNAKQWFA